MAVTAETTVIVNKRADIIEPGYGDIVVRLDADCINIIQSRDVVCLSMRAARELARDLQELLGDE